MDVLHLFRKIGVSLGVRTCELFLCFVVIVRVRAIMLTSLFSLFYVTGEFHRFLHRGRAENYKEFVSNLGSYGSISRFFYLQVVMFSLSFVLRRFQPDQATRESSR